MKPQHPLIIARDGLKAAESTFAMLVERMFKAGAAVAWERNGVHVGTVLRRGYGVGTHIRLQVRNDLTGAEYWIRVGDVIRAFEANL